MGFFHRMGLVSYWGIGRSQVPLPKVDVRRLLHISGDSHASFSADSGCCWRFRSGCWCRCSGWLPGQEAAPGCLWRQDGLCRSCPGSGSLCRPGSCLRRCRSGCDRNLRCSSGCGRSRGCSCSSGCCRSCGRPGCPDQVGSGRSCSSGRHQGLSRTEPGLNLVWFFKDHLENFGSHAVRVSMRMELSAAATFFVLIR